MEVLPAKRQEEYWTERYSKGLKNLLKIYLNQTTLKLVIFPIGGELARTYFFLKSQIT